MSITGSKSFNNSNISGTNLFSDLTKQIYINTLQIADNTNNLTGITYDADAIPVPRTTIDNETYVNNNVVIDGTASIDNTLTCNSFIDVSDKATFLNSIDVKGEMKLRDSVEPTKYLRAYYSSGMNGFVFNNEVPGSIMYFLVNDSYGNVKSVQFTYHQFFISIPMTVQTEFNMDGIMYFPNSSDPAALFYTVPTTDPGHGFWIMTRRNNYHFNIYNRDNSGNDINSFRTHHSGVYSLVPFTCEGTSTFNGDSEFNTNVIINSILNLNSNLIVNSTTITPTELSYIDGTTSNIQTQLNTKTGLSSNNTFTGTNTFNNTVSFIGNIVANSTTITPTELSYIDGTTSNIQTQLNSKPGLSSNNTYTGTNTFSNNITLTGNMNVGIGGTTSISPAELACLLGTTSNIQSTMIMKPSLNTFNNFTVNNTFPSITVGGQNQTVGFNSTTAGYTLSGTTLTFPASTVLAFSDLSTQTTAYTNTKDTKLSAIGTVVSGTLTTATLTTGAFYSAGSISLTAGTWVINTNACFTVITGSTTVGQLLTAPSTSNTSLGGTSKLSINHLNSQNCGIGTQWVLTSSNIYTPATTTTYYCLVQAAFGTASRLQFAAGNSNFEAYRIA